MFNQLETKIEEYKSNNSENKIEYQIYNALMSDPLIIAVVTPLMTRIHHEVNVYLNDLSFSIDIEFTEVANEGVSLNRCSFLLGG